MVNSTAIYSSDNRAIIAYGSYSSPLDLYSIQDKAAKTGKPTEIIFIIGRN